MSKVVYKYGPIEDAPVKVTGRVVHIGWQNGDALGYKSGVYIWCEVHMNQTDESYDVSLYPTGHSYDGEYLGTAIEPVGLVWHLVKI